MENQTDVFSVQWPWFVEGEGERERKGKGTQNRMEGTREGDQKMAGSGLGLYSLVSAVVLFRHRQMLRWSTSLPGTNFRKQRKTFTKNPQIPSVHNPLPLPTPPSLLLMGVDADSLLCKMEVIRGKAGPEDHR